MVAKNIKQTTQKLDRKRFVAGRLILSEQSVKLSFDGRLYQNTWVSLTLKTVTEIYLEFEICRLFIE